MASWRSDRTGYGSNGITVHVRGCRSVTHIEMCPFLHGSAFPQCLRYRLGSPAVDPKLGEKEWQLQEPNGCTPRLFVRDDVGQVLQHRVRGYGKEAGHRLFVLRLSKALGVTGPAQWIQLIRMKTEVNQHGTTEEKRITAALRRARVY